MTPIRDIADLRPGAVLYHSAFGFARVTAVDPDWVVLAWEGGGDNLPARVPHDVILRVYALCAAEGFFHRATHDREGIRSLLVEHPTDGLALLLGDLHGPQRESDLRDWLVGRGLFTEAAFPHWWKGVQPVIGEDVRFQVDNDAVLLRTGNTTDTPTARLENPLLAPGRRLDLALEHRETLEPDFYFAQVLLAWRTGGTQVKDLALAALKHEPAQRILADLLVMGTDAIEAIIHGIRRAGWEPDQVDEATHRALVGLVLRGLDEGGPLDAEGRLAATLARWPSPGVVDALHEAAISADGKRLLRAAFGALPPRRAELLALELLERSLETGDQESAQWLGGEALGFALVDPAEMADRIETEQPALAKWFKTAFRGVEDRPGLAEYDDSTDETLHTAEIDLSDIVSQPMPIGKLPARSGASLLGLGLAMARALSVHHKEGRVVNPTAFSVKVLPNETMEAEPSEDHASCPRPLLEPESTAADVYAASVLLLEALIGKPWPRNLPANRALPYLRTCIPLLPPSALAALDSGLHPDPMRRPQDGLAWLARWQTAAVAEENRSYASRNPTARLHVGYDSHIGKMKLLLTQTNQDCMTIACKGPLSLLCVCDGISTANAGSGDVASSIACHVIANLWEQALPRLVSAGPGEIRDFLDRALRTANTAVCEAALRFAGGNLDGRVPMGTTCTIAVVHGNWVSLAWLGDSRCYLVGPYGASIVTADENQAGERLRAWHLGFLDLWDPAGFALVGYLGHFNDDMRPEALSAHHTSFTLLPGESLMIGSDGITDYVGETHPEVASVVWDVVGGTSDPEDAARRMVGLANKGGGGDNCTCVVARLWQ
ncbi:MAG: protein phosphatase 2C domain-containing protein [Myxococcales bacterium]|nr:protein phosphatase 2C domain-containing protein [Myxococcales bacterium]